jgi:hypothetical protein
MSIRTTLHKRHRVLTHRKPAALHAEPERAAQSRVDIAKGAPRDRRMLLDDHGNSPLALPPAQDAAGTAGGGTGDGGGAAASLSDGVNVCAAARASADDDQVLDGRLGGVAVLGEIVVPVGDLSRQDLRRDAIAEGRPQQVTARPGSAGWQWSVDRVQEDHHVAHRVS